MKKLSRRDFLKLSATTTAAVALASCAPAPTQAPAKATSAPVTKPTEAPKPVTLDFLGWGDNTDIPAWDKLTKAFKEKNPNYTINVTTVADPGTNHYPKLQTMVAGGTIPDIASFQGWEWQVFAEKNLLAPVDDYVAKDKMTAPYPTGIKSLEDTTAFKGKKYLMPLQIATMLMFYARKPFQDAGIPFPTDDWTFEQFLDIAKKLTDPAKKMYGLQANGNYVRDIHWIRGTGKQEYDNLIYPKKATFNQKEIVDIVQIIASDVYNSLKIAPTPADLAAGGNTIQTGNCAMKYEGAWFFTSLNSPELRDQKKQVEFDVVLMPKQQDPDRPHRGWAEGVCLMKSTKTDAAWEFVKYMGGEGNKTYSETTGRIPNDLKLVESWWVPMIAERFQVKNGKAFIEAIKKSEVDVVGAITRTKITNEVVKPVAWDPLNNGKATAADVLSKVDAGVQKLFDEYWATVK
ncbi:MAG TPA: extracellular solute-binding protein [Anaerolineaceae bacterium]